MNGTTDRDANGAGGEVGQIFRREALESHREGAAGPGDLLRIAPAWTRWFYWLLLAIVAFGGLYLVFGKVSEYAEGPAIVTVEDKIDLTATAAGTVHSVEVRSDERVEAGRLLVRFYDAFEAADLEGLRREFELQLIALLKNPADETARDNLAGLRARIEQASSRLEERSLRAPVGGVVRDLRIRPGQPVLPGDVVLSLAGEDSPVSIVAMLPGHFRPMLHPGQSLRLEVAGYDYAYQELTIDSVGEEVIGPSEARRFLGAQIADAVMLRGPVVIVHAPLPSRTFKTSDQTHTFHDGMLGIAQARVREESLLFTLLPGLRNVFRTGVEGG